MKKPLLWVIGFLLFISILLAVFLTWKIFSSTPPEPTVKRATLINPTGPTVIPVAGLESGQFYSDFILDLHYWTNTDEALALLAAEKTDFAVLPITVATNIYAKNIDIALIGVHEWKVFYLLAPENSSFDGWQSLKGKNVYMPVGRGHTLDILTRYTLQKEGIDPDEDLQINYAPPPEIVSLFVAGKVDYAALPEPFVTQGILKGNGKIVLDFQEFWGESTGMPKRIPIAGLFVQRSFLNEYPEESKEMARIFAESTTWANENIDQAIEFSSEILPIPPSVMKSAMSRTEFDYIPIADCQVEVENFLNKMHELYPEGLPNLPDNGFYAE
jgi:NitT/TauT family transport system substrate-binding protein